MRGLDYKWIEALQMHSKTAASFERAAEQLYISDRRYLQRIKQLEKWRRKPACLGEEKARLGTQRR
ncbi:hypothetical protein OH492_03870 [Vibrio chagasii]|nr:hypothetical protein [Vibrio chagasii]